MSIYQQTYDEHINPIGSHNFKWSKIKTAILVVNPETPIKLSEIYLNRLLVSTVMALQMFSSSAMILILKWCLHKSSVLIPFYLVNERDEARQGVTEVNGFKELPAILK